MKDDNNYSEKLKIESRSFDSQIEERVSHGHVPDLRTAGRCEWFYNNPWRDAAYAQMLFGEVVSYIRKIISNYLKTEPSDVNVLEVACGPGHISLELARYGYNVTGIDISKKCVEIARDVAGKDPYKEHRGRLEYICSNIHEFNSKHEFDMAVFSSSLHHFGDQDAVLRKVSSLLTARGIIFVSEPTRIRLRDADAAIIHSIRMLLALGNNYYQPVKLPEDEEELKRLLEGIKNEFDYKDSSGKNVQSPLDNEAAFSDMYPALKANFEELEFKNTFSFFDRIIGGLRMESVDMEHKVAKWINMVDRFLCSSGFTTPEQFIFVGKKRS